MANVAGARSRTPPKPLAFASAAAAAEASTGWRANSQSPPRYCSVSGSRASKVEHEVPDRATCVGAPPLTTAQSYLRVALEELPGHVRMAVVVVQTDEW